jgi:chemotaxis protein MotB
MKTIRYILVFLSLAVGMVFTSCVSSREFAASEAQVARLQSENGYSKEQLDQCRAQSNEFNNERITLQAKYDSIQSEIISINRFSALIIDDQARRLRGLNDLVYLQKEALNELRNSISEALISYETDELNIFTKDGIIYISLAEKLLFESGSDVVDTKGRDALRDLARVLGRTSGFSVIVEGHSDDVVVSTDQFKDNWDMSVARATSVVRIISNDFGFNPNRITASGKGKFHPVQSNETEEGRAANRRIDIIITPNLEDLFKVLFQ